MGVGAPAGVFAAALVFLLAVSGARTASAQDVWMWNVADIQQYMQVSSIQVGSFARATSPTVHCTRQACTCALATASHARAGCPVLHSCNYTAAFDEGGHVLQRGDYKSPLPASGAPARAAWNRGIS